MNTLTVGQNRWGKSVCYTELPQRFIRGYIITCYNLLDNFLVLLKMVRNYVRKTNCQSWDESSMLLAIKAVIDDKNSYNKASTNYNVPHSTLQYRVKEIKMLLYIMILFCFKYW